MILHSKIIGEGNAFVVLHGFLGMGDNWKTLGMQFSEYPLQVHLVDQRNHGRSFHDSTFNYEVLVEDLKNYCDHYHLRSIILLGHSMGGKTAMSFAVKYPEMVSKLLIADISPRYYPVHHDVILNGLYALDFNKIKTRKEADLKLAEFVSDFGTRQFLLKNVYWVEKGVLGLRLNLSVLKENVSEVGEALEDHAVYNGETLFLKGDKSEYIGTQEERLIKKHFPKAEVNTIENAGHWLHAENPRQFYEKVIQFVSH